MSELTLEKIKKARKLFESHENEESYRIMAIPFIATGEQLLDMVPELDVDPYKQYYFDGEVFSVYE
jgi:hypothetical protein